MELMRYPDDSLRVMCESVFPGDVSQETISSMVETMYAGNGVGLAGPQVGIKKSVFVMDPTGGERTGYLEVLINPEIIEISSDMQTFLEGCLSIPGVAEEVQRHKRLVARYVNARGEQVTRTFEGFPATIFQHELDHLVGKLFIDRVSSLKRGLILKEYAKASRVL